jgi:hypothetical protein
MGTSGGGVLTEAHPRLTGQLALTYLPECRITLAGMRPSEEFAAKKARNQRNYRARKLRAEFPTLAAGPARPVGLCGPLWGAGISPVPVDPEDSKAS